MTQPAGPSRMDMNAALFSRYRMVRGELVRRHLSILESMADPEGFPLLDQSEIRGLIYRRLHLAVCMFDPAGPVSFEVFFRDIAQDIITDLARRAHASARGFSLLTDPSDADIPTMHLVAEMRHLEEKLRCNNVPLVFKVASRMRVQWLAYGIDREEKNAEGMMVLVKAMRLFDIEWGAPFYSYARAALTNGLNVQKGDRPQDVTSLDAQVGEDTDANLHDMLGGEPPDYDSAILVDQLRERILKVATPLDQVIVKRWLGLDEEERRTLVRDPVATRRLRLLFSEFDSSNREVPPPLLVPGDEERLGVGQSTSEFQALDSIWRRNWWLMWTDPDPPEFLDEPAGHAAS
jgi:hypothetical protein